MIPIAAEIAVANLVDTLGTGALLDAIAAYCDEQAQYAREDHGERDPEAAAWQRWADLLRELPGLQPRVPTLPWPEPRLRALRPPRGAC